MQTSSDAPIPGLPGGEGDAEARYQTLLNGVLHGVVFQDADGRIHSANPAAQRILGLSLAQLQERNSEDARWQIIREDGSPFPGEAHPAMVALQTGQAVEGVVMGVFNPERAETRWISVSAAPLFRPGELRAHQVMTTFADITDKVRLGFVQVFLAKAHWLITGEDFFLALARFLAQHLGVDYVCIDRLVGEGMEAETLAIWFDGHFDDNQRYALKDTPCGEVVGKSVCCFPQGVRHQFPKDQVLQDMGAESYLGVTLWGAQGQPIGLIALIGRRPLVDRALAESTLALVGARAAGELERRESEHRFRSLFQDVESVAVQSYGPDGITHYWNKASENLYGYSAQEAVGKSLLELIIPPELRAEVSAAMGRMGQTGQRIPASELSLMRKDGSRVSVYSSHTVVAVPGQPRELFCIDIDLTAFKQASEELERSEAELRRQNHLFSALLDLLPVGVFMVEAPSGKPLVANGEALKLLGRGILLDASRNNLSEVYKAYKYGTRTPYPLDQMPIVLGMNGQVSRVDDMVVERPDGSTSLLEVFGSPVRDDHGNTWASLASFFDITERKRAEDALREREELLRLSLQGADLGAWDWDMASGHVTVNERWWEMLGFQPGELDSHMQHFDARVHPDDLANVRAALEAHIHQKTPAYESTHRLRHKDGRWIWILDRGRVILRDAGGAALRMCGTHLDITESQRQASLEAARLRLTEFPLTHTLPELLQATVDEAAVLADSPIGFFHFVDDDEKTISLAAWSTRTLQEFCAAKGFNSHYSLQQAGVWADCLRQREAVIHNDFEALTHRKGLPPGHAQVHREMVVPLFRGERIVALLGVGNKPEPYGAPDIRLVERLAEVAWVIIERKRAEEQQRQLQAQLQQAQKMESLGILAGGVAHDMNNVLGAILGWASASLETQPEGSATYRAFDTISRAALRGGTLVRSLLSFARQSPAEAHELDMNAILQEEVHLLERTTLAKVTLELELAPDLKPMRGDVGALTHALMNLCVNAVDAMPEGGTLTLRTRNAEPPWIEIQVEDTGEGMPTSVLTKALDPFFTTKGVGKGTGLGLSMVYSTVKAHQGEMNIESEPGWGTRVTLRFPACNAEVVPVEAAPAPPPQRRPEALAVLLVDDDELIRSSIQALLEAMGHEATAVASGEAALERMEAGYGPDVVILDMNMPGLGGAGTLPRLRSLNARVPVLLATGRADQAALDLIAAHPQVTLLAKPFTMAQLKSCLEVLRPRP